MIQNNYLNYWSKYNRTLFENRVNTHDKINVSESAYKVIKNQQSTPDNNKALNNYNQRLFLFPQSVL